MLTSRSEDSPVGHTVDVTRAKTGSSLCSMCYYQLRGSFPEVKLGEMKEAMETHEAVQEKRLGL